MARIKVVTDSAADLPANLVASHDIAVVPLEVRLEGHRVEELRDISPERFWQIATTSTELATTAAPSPGDFATVFGEAQREGFDAVMCITISGALSATYQAAMAAANDTTFPTAVIDSRFATMGEGLVVLEAAERAADNPTLQELQAHIADTIGRTFTLGTLDTLEYLRRGGRIGSAQAFLGSLLSIKPVIEVRDGVVEAESRQRTRTRSLQYLADKVRSFGPLERFSVVHAAASDVDNYVAMVSDLDIANGETIVTFIGPVIGAHTGPGTIGVCGIHR